MAQPCPGKSFVSAVIFCRIRLLSYFVPKMRNATYFRVKLNLKLTRNKDELYENQEFSRSEFASGNRAIFFDSVHHVQNISTMSKPIVV